MVPARLSVLSKMLTPRRYRDPAAMAVAPGGRSGRMRRRADEVRHVVYEQERLGSRTGYVLQAPRRCRLVEPPSPAADPAADLDPRRERRPDHPTGQRARIMRALPPDATLHVYDDGHLGLITAADGLGSIVSQFLLA